MSEMSLKSTALEPLPGTRWYRRIIPVYGMVILTVLLVAVFSFAKSDSFPTLTNFQVLASGNATLFLLALAATIPMVAGKIDLSFGYGVGLWQIMSLQWQIMGLDYRLVIILVLLGGAIVGVVNALLIEMAQVDAFIATLATGQVIYAISYWVTGGKQITDNTGMRAVIFDDLAHWSVGPVPGPFLVAIALALVLWIVLDYLPVGRYLYAVGANPKAAELTGIRRRRYVFGAMIASGVITALAGILLAARQGGVAQSNIGPEYLLAALTAAFLGSTTIRPGRVNAFGTVVGVLIAVIGISGLMQLLPGQFYLSPLFNGLTLVAAITIASLATRRRVARSSAPTTMPPRNGEPSAGDSSAAPEPAVAN